MTPEADVNKVIANSAGAPTQANTSSGARDSQLDDYRQYFLRRQRGQPLDMSSADVVKMSQETVDMLKNINTNVEYATSQLMAVKKKFDDAMSLSPAPPLDENVNAVMKAVLDEMAASVLLLKEIKGNIKQVSDDVTNTFTDTRVMYASVFILGIALVVIAIPVALVLNNQLFALVFGGAGVIDILAFFLKDPPQQLQKSRANLTKLQAAYSSWLTDMTSWSIFLYNLSQFGDQSNINVSQMKEASSSYVKNFRDLMSAVEDFDKGVSTSKNKS